MAAEFEVKLRANFLNEYFVGSDLRDVVEVVTNNAAYLAKSQVTKRTGTLAASVHPSVGIDKVLVGADRWVGTVDMGSEFGAQGEAFYAGSYEYGAGNHPNSTGRHHNRAAHVFDVVLDQLDGL